MALNTIAVLATCSSLAAIRHFPRSLRPIVLFASILAAVSISLIIIINLESILGLFGRDVTFTGRTPIWAAIWEWILERPFFGYGYAFWVSEGRELARLRIQIGFDTAAHSHNTWLDIWLQMGIFALIAIMIAFFRAMLTSIKLFIFDEIKLSVVFLSLLLFFLYRSFTEVSLADPYIVGVFWVAWCATWVDRISEDRRRTKGKPAQVVASRRTGSDVEIADAP